MRVRQAGVIALVAASVALIQGAQIQGALAGEPATKSSTQKAGAAPPAVAAKKDAKGAGKAPPVAPKNIALEPSGVQFGMTVEGIAAVYDKWWEQYYLPEYNKTNPGPKMRELDYQLEQRKGLFRRVKAFEGYPDSFDKSPLKGEFVRSNGEAMTWAKVPPVAAKGKVPAKSGYLRRFFFHKGLMWKVYDEYQLDAQSPYGQSFDSAVKFVATDLGRKGRRLDPSEGSLQLDSYEFDDGQTLLRVVSLSDKKVAIVRSDKALAGEVVKSREQIVTKEPTTLDNDVKAILK
jgi:hypothetical protein